MELGKASRNQKSNKMKMKLLFIICLFSNAANAQQWDWAKREGGGQYDNASAVATDKVGNTYLAGRTGGNSGQIFLNKYDSGGTVLWTKTLLEGGNEACGITVDFSGCIYVTGYFTSSTLSFDSIILNKQSYIDLFLVKYNPNGTVIWAKRAGGSARGASVTADLSGNVFVCGSFSSLVLTFDSITVNNLYLGTISGQTPNRNLFLTKYDSNGNVIWVKVAGGNYNNADPADASSVTTDNLGNVYMTGGFACMSIAFGPQVLVLQNNTNRGGDMFIVKYDNNGNTIWAKSAGNIASVWAASVAVDAFGNVYVAGSFASFSLTFDSFTLINPHGSSCCWYGSQYYADFIVKYENNGNVSWAKTLYGNNGGQANAITIDVCGNIYMTGYKSNLTIHTINMFLVRLDEYGNILLTKNAEGGNNSGSSLASDLSGNVYVAGNFRNDSILLTPYLLNNAGNKQMFIAKLTASGVFAPIAPAASNITICIGNTASIHATGIGTLGWYSAATGGIYLGGGSNFTTPVLTTDTTFYVQDSTCAASASRTPVNVTINYLKPPSPSASNSTICSGNTASLSAIGSGTLGWYSDATVGIYLGGGANYSSPSLTTSTTYYVQDSTCSASSMRTAVLVTVDNLKPPAPAGTNTTICSGSTASLSASGIGTLGWYTEPTAGIYIGEGTNLITPVLTTTTTYFVQDSTCAASSIRTPVIVTVNSLPQVTANTKATIVCLGSSVILTGEGASSYIWSGGVTDGISFVPSSSTAYTVTGTDLNNCSNTSTITVTVSPLPDVGTNLNGTIISVNQTEAVYQWLDCNNGNSPIADATNQNYTAVINGNYAVIVSMNGCSDTSACINFNITGINEIPNNNNQLIIFPNPGNGALTIQSTSDGVYSIMNESGQQIQLFELNSGNKFSINIEDLSNGIYFIVGYNNDQMIRQKVVVAK